MNRSALYISRKVLYRQAVLLVPIVSIFIVVMLTLYEAHRYREFGREVVVTKKQIAQLEALIKDLDAKPPLTVIPVILQSGVEQPDFIDVLRSRAEQSHVILNRWANATVLAVGTGAGNPGATGASSGPPSLPSDVTAINCSIEAAGTYNSLRHFLYSLQYAPRLFTLSDMVWQRNDKWPITTLKFNLTRYISLSGTAPVHMPGPTKVIAASVRTDSVATGKPLQASGTHNPLLPFSTTGF